MEEQYDYEGRLSLAGWALGVARLHCLVISLCPAVFGALLAPIQVAYAENNSATSTSLVARSTLLSHADGAKEIGVVLVLPLKDPKAAEDFVKHASTRGDSIYGQYLTPEQFASSYGPSESDYTEIKNWATANGLRISDESTSRTTLTVRGSVSRFERLFNVQINNYQSAQAGEFYAASTEPVISSAIATKLMGVIGLSGGLQKAPLAKVYKRLGEIAPQERSDVTGGTGPGGAYSAADLRTAYAIPSLGATAPQTVALFEQGGFFASDVHKYLVENNLPDVPVKNRPVNGSGNIVTDPGVELEAVLDIDMIIGTNPAVKRVLVYEDGIDPFGVALLDALAQIASDNAAQTLSISYGEDEVEQGTTEIAAEGQLFVQLAAQGITVLVSSGDGGAYGRSGGGLNVSDPGAQPYVTSVGGTTLFLGQNSEWLYEEVWNDLGSDNGASGGGVSSYWTIPAYQLPTILETTNGGSATYRNLPDVAAVGDPYTGVAVYSKINGGWLQIGGTSVSAPIWAGFVSQMNSAAETLHLGRLGFFNPKVYQFGQFSEGLIDITNGNNGDPILNNGVPGYYAGLLYDNCSGYGSFYGQGLAPFVLAEWGGTGNPPAAFGGLSGTAQATAAEISWSVSTGATGYLVEVLNEYNGLVNFYVSTSTKYEVTGLTPKTYYGIAVLAVDKNGYTASDSVIFLKTIK